MTSIPLQIVPWGLELQGGPLQPSSIKQTNTKRDRDKEVQVEKWHQTSPLRATWRRPTGQNSNKKGQRLNSSPACNEWCVRRRPWADVTRTKTDRETHWNRKNSLKTAKKGHKKTKGEMTRHLNMEGLAWTTGTGGVRTWMKHEVSVSCVIRADGRMRTAWKWKRMSTFHKSFPAGHNQTQADIQC